MGLAKPGGNRPRLEQRIARIFASRFCIRKKLPNYIVVTIFLSNYDKKILKFVHANCEGVRSLTKMLESSVIIPDSASYIVLVPPYPKYSSPIIYHRA